MAETVATATTSVTIDLIDVINATVDPTVTTTTQIAVTIVATIAAMTDVMIDATTTAATIIVKTTGTTGGMIAVTTCMMVVVARTTTITTTTTARSLLHHHRQKGATPMVRFRPPTGRPTSSLVVTKQPRATYRNDQIQGRSSKSTLKLHNLCVGRSTQSLSLGEGTGCKYLTPGLTR
jgi:hypothetical protein